jgi:glucose 1-dehydrogenase
MDELLTGKRALVTGGSRGIGAALCRVLVREGASVAINYHRSPAEAEALAAALGDRAVAVGGDVSVEAEVVRMVRTAADQLGGLDILINNAGVETTVAAIDMPMAEWDRVMNTNLRGAFMCAREAARVMRDQGTGGVIINNSSIHEAIPRLGLVHYAASKAGLHMLTKALGLEWAELGIRVIGVSPGAIETEMNRAEIDAFGREKFEAWIPVGRIGTVADVAEAVAFLASDRAAYISATTLTIDGAYMQNVIRYDPRREE